jgi:hypothetical protein
VQAIARTRACQVELPFSAGADDLFYRQSIAFGHPEQTGANKVEKVSANAGKTGEEVVSHGKQDKDF